MQPAMGWLEAASARLLPGTHAGVGCRAGACTGAAAFTLLLHKATRRPEYKLFFALSIVLHSICTELAMATKTDFTHDEWKLLLESVMMAGIAVTAADPSGLWGTLKESFASAQTLAAGKAGSSDLVKALVADLETSEGRAIARDGLRERLKDSKAVEIKTKAVDALRQAAALLAKNTPQDAAATKAWLRQISHNVAEASKEGGFLGLGGVPVSEAEKATLAEIDAALKG
jgi:hypothetical protein